MQRKIIHIDMDAFFASVEQRQDPNLKGKPVVVGGNPHGRGVVAAASYEARKFGIHSAMPSVKAYRLCPKAIFVKPHFDLYRQASQQIMKIFREYTDLVEPLSLDEAYLDVTQNKMDLPYATTIAKEIKTKIFKETSLTASAGVAPNKFLAKIASDMNKPNGLTVIRPDQIEIFLMDLPVRKVPGIGEVTEKKMANLKIFTVNHLRNYAIEDLICLFGKVGNWYYKVARGEDHRKVSPNRMRKSVGVENTFEKNLMSQALLEEKLNTLSLEVEKRLVKKKFKGKTLTLKVTYADFEKITRSRTLEQSISDNELIYLSACQLLKMTEAGKRPIRLLGLSLSNLSGEDLTGSMMKHVNSKKEQIELAFL